jgi:chemotaxis protein MotA
MAKKSSIDFASVIGLALGPMCILLGQYIEGGDPSSLLQKSAALIVIGGTVGSCLVSFSSPYLIAAVRDLHKVISEPAPDPYELIDRIVNYSTIMRKEGPVTLQRHVRTETYPMLRKGLSLIVSNIAPAAISSILERTFQDRVRLANAGAEVFEAAGGYLPTFGILGAVLGLIHTMSDLNDPSKVGIGIATAFVATVYGVGLANLIAFPIAKKIRSRAVTEKQLDKIVITAISNMKAGLAGAPLRQLLAESIGAGSSSAGTNAKSGTVSDLQQRKTG